MSEPCGWIYGIQSGLFIKVGKANQIAHRLHEMNLYNPHPCKVVMRRQTIRPVWVEKRIHKILEPYAIGREWFMVDAIIVRLAATAAIKELREVRIQEQIREKELDACVPVVCSENEKIIPLKKQVNS